IGQLTRGWKLILDKVDCSKWLAKIFVKQMSLSQFEGMSVE
ncbi:unnamed protein product, partial [Allacma fusca]